MDLDINLDKKIEFYKDYVDFEESTPIESIVTKIEILFLNKADNSKLSNMLEKLIKTRNFFDELDRIVHLSRYINPSLIESMESILKAKFSDIRPKYYYNFLTIVYSAKSKFKDAIESFEQQYEYQPINGTYFSRKSYLLLKNKSYEDVINLKEEYISNNFDFEEDFEVLKINAMYANKMLNDAAYDESLLRTLSSSENKLIKIASRLLVDNTRSQAIQNIISMIKADPRNYFMFDDWEILTSDELTNIKSKIEVNNKINTFL
ncbi:hypothetical protein [Psychrobacter sp. CMS30]|uniref:hypothetical protein n=1 Tax=Psychrobacter sp. CMS30 TaxID=2774126 RepID=UPI001918EA99|nr:hypothetical protein [Psychrobacter sp. CMS30]